MEICAKRGPGALLASEFTSRGSDPSSDRPGGFSLMPKGSGPLVAKQDNAMQDQGDDIAYCILEMSISQRWPGRQMYASSAHPGERTRDLERATPPAGMQSRHKSTLGASNQICASSTGRAWSRGDRACAIQDFHGPSHGVANSSRVCRWAGELRRGRDILQPTRRLARFRGLVGCR